MFLARIEMTEVAVPSTLRRAAVLVRTAAYVTHSAVVSQLRMMAAKAGMVSLSFLYNVMLIANR